jgi:hypothetical protein
VTQPDSVHTLTPCFFKNLSNVEENFSSGVWSHVFWLKDINI